MKFKNFVISLLVDLDTVNSQNLVLSVTFEIAFALMLAIFFDAFDNNYRIMTQHIKTIIGDLLK